MKDNSVHLSFVSDRNYAVSLGVLLCSIFKNSATKDNKIIHIFDTGIDPTDRNKLKNLVTQHNSKIHFYSIDTAMYHHLHIDAHFTYSNFAKLQIPGILNNLSKVLYLDCDMLAIDDVDKIYSRSFETTIAAVHDVNVFDATYLGMQNHLEYFNSGVMLINIQKWRENHTDEKLDDLIRRNEIKAKYVEQDFLNVVLHIDWTDLGIECNTQAQSFADYSTGKIGSIILHFTGPQKPWSMESHVPFRNLYAPYLLRSPWKWRLFSLYYNALIPQKLKIFLRKYIFDKVGIRRQFLSSSTEVL